MLKKLITLFRKEEPAHIRMGRWGERVAARRLKQKGYRILGKRVRVGRRDELDVVARKEDTLVFVEVKTRGSESFARPLNAVNRAKRHALSRAAVRYLQRLKELPTYIRFDVVEVIGTEAEGNPVIRHIEDVFPLDNRYRLPW